MLVHRKVATLPTRTHLTRLGAALIALAVLLPWAWRMWDAPFDYSLWTDRDLYRSDVAFTSLPTSGSELSFLDARTPGGMMHVLWWTALQLRHAAQDVFRLGVLLEGLGTLGIAWMVSRRGGVWAAAISAAMMLYVPATVESSTRLWNPSFVLGFAAAQPMAAVWWLHSGKLRALFALGVATGLAAQMHMGGALPGVALLAASLAYRPSYLFRGGVAALAGLALTYAPFLLHEATSGASAALLASGTPSSRTHAPWPGVVPWAGLAQQLGLGSDHPRSPIAWSNLLYVGVVPALVVPIVQRNTPRVERAVPWVLLAGALSVPLFHLPNPRITYTDTWDGRYLVAVVPCLAALVGIGWGRLWRAASQRTSATVVLWSVGTACALAPPIVAWTSPPPPSDESYAVLTEALGTLSDTHSVTLQDLSGRTTLWWADSRRWSGSGDRGIAWMLSQRGQTPRGSLPPPCYAFLFQGAHTPLDMVALAEQLDPSLGPVTLLDDRVVGRHRYVQFDVEAARCPTSLIDRYVPTEAEETVARAWPSLAPDTARSVTAPAGSERWVVRAHDDAFAYDLGLAVDLSLRGDVVTATLHGQQLRGVGFNPGLLSMAWIAHARVVFRDGPRTVELPLSTATIGELAVTPPVSAQRTLPPGRWTAHVAFTRVTHHADPRQAATPVDIALTGGLLTPHSATEQR